MGTFLFILGVAIMISGATPKKNVDWTVVCKIENMSEKDRAKYQDILNEEAGDGYDIQLEELCEK